jgi:tRNA pseudouridine38-40 synthase
MCVTQEENRIVGAGRTDAGAHALSQVIAFSTESKLSPQSLVRAINAYLPRDIAVISAYDVDPAFHPRYDAISRVYRYLIWNRQVRSPFWEERSAHIWRRLDAARMHFAAQHLIGRHNFGAFAPTSARIERTRTMYRASCRRDGELVVVELEAQGFLRQMVRSVVGTLVDVGHGKIDAEDFRRILCSGNRSQASVTMPACGLHLVEVKYQSDTSGIEGGTGDEHSVAGAGR